MPTFQIDAFEGGPITVELDYSDLAPVFVASLARDGDTESAAFLDSEWIVKPTQQMASSQA